MKHKLINSLIILFLCAGAISAWSAPNVPSNKTVPLLCWHVFDENLPPENTDILIFTRIDRYGSPYLWGQYSPPSRTFWVHAILKSIPQEEVAYWAYFPQGTSCKQGQK